LKILAIETSCDETAIALVEASGGLKNPRFKIFKNLVASQIKIHRPYGGVVPTLAKREHLRNLPNLFNKILLREADRLKSKIPAYADLPADKAGASAGRKNQKSKLQFKIQKFFKTIDLITVTVGPGLEPCLWTGINFAKDLAKKWKKTLSGTSHLEGHLYSFLLPKTDGFRLKNLFPAIALVVSGGHTALLLMKDLAHCKKLGETRDDAAGECFDKVARLLHLPYPGGPAIEKLSKSGNPAFVIFPRPMMNQKNFDFSFSGLKTAVLYYLRQSINSEGRSLDNWRLVVSKPPTVDVAASFQAAVFDVLITKTLRAARQYRARSFLLSGGVASNKAFQKKFALRIKKDNPSLKFLAPPRNFCLDNAAMIAVAGYLNFLKSKKYRLTARGDLTI